MNLTNIKNIVFDLGGVILTLDKDESVNRFEKIGLKRAKIFLNPYHQNGIFLDLEEGKLSETDFYDAIRTEIGENIPDEKIIWSWMGFIADCPEYKLQMLEDLRNRGYKLYILSNTNPCIMKWAMSSKFSKTGKKLSQFFDKLYLSYKMGCVKPNPKIFYKMIADSCLIPSETLFIDDSQANIETGKQLGFKIYHSSNGEDLRHLFNV